MNRISGTLIISVLASLPLSAQIPMLNSSPTSTSKVIYLDFDGQKVTGTSWYNGNTINAQPSGVSSAAMIQIWKRVSEDYRPFDVNVTTDSTKFNNAQSNRRMRIIFTPTDSWYSPAGGVAYLNSFSWGGTPGTPCWVFEDNLGKNAKSMAEAASHEAGHTLGLRHQSIYNSSCVKTDEYHDGWGGSGVTSWAPIMGVGYGRNVTIWHSGTNAQSCTTIQNDHGTSGITSINSLSFLPDDVGGNLVSAKMLNLGTTLTIDSGIITQPTDLDAFRFTICDTRHVTINAKPFALDTNNYYGANLDIRLHIYDAAGNTLALDTTLTRLYAIRALTLNPGTYYFTIDGGRSNNYTDYGSLGKYYLYIKATNPPAIAASILTNSLCATQSVALASSVTGGATNWLWTVNGSTTFSSTAQAPVLVFNPGTHTLSLLASSGSYTGCPVTSTLEVLPVPQVAVSGNSLICPMQSVLLQASGAQNYTWMPGGSTGAIRSVSSNSPLSYTVTGSNGVCSNTAAMTVSVSPEFTLNLTASKTITCLGDTVLLTASGASDYTLSPGALQGNSVVITPGISANYYLTGKVGACEQVDMVGIIVIPNFTLDVSASTDFACLGDTIQITASGANNYIFAPGNTASNPAPFIVSGPSVYTVTAFNHSLCPQQATTAVNVMECEDDDDDVTGLNEFKEVLLNIFPNPGHDQVTITGAGNALITISDLHGAILFQTVNAGNVSPVITCRNWARGLYFIQVLDANGALQTRKLLLE